MQCKGQWHPQCITTHSWRNVEGRSSRVLELYICIRGGKKLMNGMWAISQRRTKSQKKGSILAASLLVSGASFLAPIYWIYWKRVSPILKALIDPVVISERMYSRIRGWSAEMEPGWKHAYSSSSVGVLIRACAIMMLFSWMIMLRRVILITIISLLDTGLLLVTLVENKLGHNTIVLECWCMTEIVWKSKLWNRGLPILAKVWTLYCHFDLPYPCEWQTQVSSGRGDTEVSFISFFKIRGPPEPQRW